MKVLNYAVVGILASAVWVGCGGDDTTGGGTTGTAGASGGAMAGAGGGTGGDGTGGSGQSSGGSAGTSTTTGGSSGSGGGSATGGAGGAGGGGDISNSDECNAYCMKATTMCAGATCDKSFSCGIRSGACAASTRAYLKCAVDTGTWSCINGGGYSVISSCRRDNTLCM